MSKRFVEIRSYNLVPGTRADFDGLMTTLALPMLQRWQVDVVASGASPHDEDSYYLIRAYASLEERQASQDAFYGSDEWRSGPRENILALIESYASIVLELEESVVNAMRR
ncbi:MAG TPA: NIPSNAP family protein [Thermoanaerobaculia bacterium]|nr:NIPSNAP family protein [Thermoanaerobaculia bacterium]